MWHLAGYMPFSIFTVQVGKLQHRETSSRGQGHMASRVVGFEPWLSRIPNPTVITKLSCLAQSRPLWLELRWVRWGWKAETRPGRLNRQLGHSCGLICILKSFAYFAGRAVDSRGDKGQGRIIYFRGFLVLFFKWWLDFSCYYMPLRPQVSPFALGSQGNVISVSPASLRISLCTQGSQ